MAFPSHREQKNAARAALHAALSGPAYYQPPQGDWQKITIREHYVMVKRGEVTGLDIRSAYVTTVNEDQTKLVFLRSDVNVPVRGALVAVSSELAYRVADAEESDGITVKAAVTRLSVEESAVIWGRVPTTG